MLEESPNYALANLTSVGIVLGVVYHRLSNAVCPRGQRGRGVWDWGFWGRGRFCYTRWRKLLVVYQPPTFCRSVMIIYSTCIIITSMNSLKSNKKKVFIMHSKMMMVSNDYSKLLIFFNVNKSCKGIRLSITFEISKQYNIYTSNIIFTQACFLFFNKCQVWQACYKAFLTGHFTKALK